MRELRFGLRRLDEKVRKEVRLKSIFGLKPRAGCEVDFELRSAVHEVHLEALALNLLTIWDEAGDFTVAIEVTACGDGTPVEGATIYLENQNNPDDNETATTGTDGWAYFSALTSGEIYNGTLTLPDAPDVTMGFVLDLWAEIISPDVIAIPQRVEILVEGETCHKDLVWSVEVPEGATAATIISRDNERLVLEISCPGFRGPCVGGGR